MDYYKANVSFSGVISMHEGEIRCITSKKLIKDLTKAGYIRKLNKKEIEAMKVLGLIKEEVIEDEGLDGDFDEGQDENLEEEQNDGKEDEENLSENQEIEEENGSDEDVITDEG